MSKKKIELRPLISGFDFAFVGGTESVRGFPTVIASDSKTTQPGGDNRKKFPLGAALQVPQNFSFAPL